MKVLDKVNLEFPAGELVFLVGYSGSGKSTISSIILRMYDITSGIILVDGAPITSLSSKWLRDNITVVEQQSVLFNTSIEDNIKLGSCIEDCEHEISSLQLQESIDFALLQSIIDASANGLDTIVGVGGSRLSGGQRQRIALARARIRDTPILILDESVSALDLKSRIRIMQHVRKWRKGKTTIIITHEIEQIGNHDKYFMLAQGKNVSQGYGSDLRRLKGLPSTPEDMDPFADDFNSLQSPASEKRMSMPDLTELFKSHHRENSEQSEFSIGPLKNTESETVRYSKFVRNSVFRPQSALYFVPPVSEPDQEDKWYIPPIPESINKSDVHASETEVSKRHMSINLDALSKKAPAMKPRPLSLLPTRQVKIIRPASTPPNFSPPPSPALYMPKVTYVEDHVGDGPDLEANNNQEYMKYISAQEAASLHVSSIYIFKACYSHLNHKGLLWLGIIVSVVNGAVTPIFSFVISKLIAYMVSVRLTNDSPPIMWILLAIGIAVFDSGTTYARALILGFVADRWVRDMREKAFATILLQDMEWYSNNKIETNDISTLIITHSEDIRSIVTSLLSVTATSISLALLCIIWVMISGWRLCLLGLSLVSLYYLASAFTKFVVVRWEGKCIELNAMLEELIHETVSGIRTLRILALEKMFVRRYDAADGDLQAARLRDSIYSGVSFGITSFIPFLCQSLLLWYGMKLIADNIYSSGTILTVYSILFFSIASVSTLLQAVPQMHTKYLTCLRLFQILDYKPELSKEHKGQQSKVRFAHGMIEFKDVHFSYVSQYDADDKEETRQKAAAALDASKRKVTKVRGLFEPQNYEKPLVKVLDSFTATVPALKTTAIIGPSGSGKSTLVALLTKLYAPTAGKILVDGMNLQNVDTDLLRQDVAVVGQMPLHFFDGTIYENICFAIPGPKPTLEEVRNICRDCAIDDFVSSLPEGYETRIGGSTGPVSSGGTSLLSGGQMQRIGIARALIRRPKILVLDECTSGLDQVSTDAIKKTLTSFKGKMTVLIITHQADVASIADMVITVNEGRRVDL